eukprot:11214303-Lingulodinium_polyedra.AAC.1
MFVVETELCTIAGGAGNRMGFTGATDADGEDLVPAMPICDGPQLHRGKGGPLPFFNACVAAKAVAPSKSKKPVEAVCPWGFFNRALRDP